MRNLGGTPQMVGGGIGASLSSAEKQEMRRHACLQLALACQPNVDGATVLANAKMFENYLSGAAAN